MPIWMGRVNGSGLGGDLEDTWSTPMPSTLRAWWELLRPDGPSAYRDGRDDVDLEQLRRPTRRPSRRETDPIPSPRPPDRT